ncbi:Imitation switch two complex protein 1 [Spathaspora sp. JA1]|nr:Imitation switch two complex protein 1 [Spathaspora sp. JA1]
MVLYKRKQVTFIPPPEIPSDSSTQVWFIPQTKEWFLTYEEYLTRMDYYYKRKFVCEITGNSCLTFFEAYESELKEIKGVELNFPESLREHILRFLQFNRITRLDQLVDKVYSVFKCDYFPGETIFIKGIEEQQSPPASASQSTPPSQPSSVVIKQRGIIREKVQYGQSNQTKYLVVRLNDMQQAIVTNDNISRDRNHFTKWLIKTFIKLTMSRSHKVGAPWVVKDKYAKKYSIPQVYPEDLKHFADSTPTGEILYITEKKNRRRVAVIKQEDATPASTPAPVERKKRQVKTATPTIEPTPQPVIPFRKKFPTHYLPDKLQRELELEELKETPSFGLSSLQPTKKNIVDDLQLKFDLQNSKPLPKSLALPSNSVICNNQLVEKYSTTNQDEIFRLTTNSITSIQDALQSWIFINIYHKVLKLDTFTFDDFIYCMGWNWQQYEELGRCELLDEIWCGCLSAIVSNELPTRKEQRQAEDDGEIFGLNIQVPAKKGEEQDEEVNGSDTDEEDKVLKIDEPETEDEEENGVVVKKEVVIIKDDEPEDEEEPEEEEEEVEDRDSNYVNSQENDGIPHNAYICMNYRNIPWHERLRKRNFKDGNWQCILLGVLSLVEHVPQYKPIIEQVFIKLAPKSMPATSTTVLDQFYQELDIDLKLQILTILIDLVITSPLVRDYIDDCLEQSSQLRRMRLDNIKDYKANLETAQKANQFIYNSLNPNEEDKKPRLNYSNLDFNDVEREKAKTDSEFAEQLEIRKSGLIKLNQIKQEKHSIEQKLTELDCQRVKLLGKDRLFNRYWWFENNGLPNLHSGNSNGDEDDEDDDEKDKEDVDDEDDKDEVSDETYLMGRLWVQGPSNDDLRIRFGSNFEESERFNQDWKRREFDLKEQPIKQEAVEEKKSTQIREMDFTNISSAYKSTVKTQGIEFAVREVKKEGDLVIDHEGSLVTPVTSLTPSQRKSIEEFPDPLINGTNWRYYDHPEEIVKLLAWLNPWGKRETALRKELTLIKDVIISNIEARRKALWMDETPPDELELENNIDKLKTKREKLGEEEEPDEEDDEDDDVVGTKRNLRRKQQTPRKRQKVNTLEDALSFGNEVEITGMIEKFNEELSEKKQDRDFNRVVEWVNSFALESLGKSLYEGGDKFKSNKTVKVTKKKL